MMGYGVVNRRTGAALLAVLALGIGGQAASAPKGVVDPKTSSIIRADPASLGFDPAKLAVASAGLKADVAAGKIAGA